MVYRKGELQSDGIDRGWPHQVALPAGTVQGRNYDVIHAFCRDEGLSLCLRGHAIGELPIHHVIFCFADEVHANRFRARFGGFMVEPTAKARRLATEKLRAQREVSKSDRKAAL